MSSPTYLDFLMFRADAAVQDMEAGRWQEAKQTLFFVIERQLHVLGPRHRDTLASIMELISAYQNLGEWLAAEQALMQVLNIIEAVLPEHADEGLKTDVDWQGKVLAGENEEERMQYVEFLERMPSLVQPFCEAEEWERCERVAKRAAGVAAALLGLEHSTTTYSIIDLALALTYQGQWAEVEQMLLPLFNRLDTSAPQTEKERQTMPIMMNNLGTIYWKQERFAEAEKLYLRALKLAEATSGERPIYDSDHASILLFVYNEQRRWEQAEQLLREMIASATATLGAEDRITLRLAHDLAFGPLYQQQRWTAAEELVTHVAEGLQKIYGPEHEDTKRVLTNLAWIRRKLAEHESDLGRAPGDEEILGICERLENWAWIRRKLAEHESDPGRVPDDEEILGICERLRYLGGGQIDDLVCCRPRDPAGC